MGLSIGKLKNLQQFSKKRIFHLGLAAIRAASEIIVSHGNSNLTHHIDLVVVKDHLRPALAAVDGKAFMALASCNVVIAKASLLDRGKSCEKVMCLN